VGVAESYIEILNLVHRYPELIDAGDFTGVGELLRDATVVFEGVGGVVLAELTGADAIAASYRGVLVHEDGTPRTQHLVANPIVEIDEEAGTATCRYRLAVLQQTHDFPLQPVWAIRYEDHLERREGAWRIVRRRGFGHMPGDTSHHLRSTPPVS
jgi:hypothetical protein